MGEPQHVLQKWTMQHEMVVAYHLSGKTAQQIADLTDFHRQYITTILQQPEARKIIRRAQLELRKKMQENIEGRLLKHAETASRRIGETLDHEFVPGSKQKKHQDKLSIDVLKGTGFLSKDIGGQETPDRPPLSESLAKRLTTALEAANEAEELRTQEADFTIEEEGPDE